MIAIPGFLRRKADATKPSRKTMLTPAQERKLLTVLNALQDGEPVFFGMRLGSVNINLTSNGTIAIQGKEPGEWVAFDDLKQFSDACSAQALN